MEQSPFVEDAQKVEKRILVERLDNALLQGIIAKAAQGQLDSSTLAAIRRAAEGDTPLHDIIATYSLAAPVEPPQRPEANPQRVQQVDPLVLRASQGRRRVVANHPFPGARVHPRRLCKSYSGMRRRPVPRGREDRVAKLTAAARKKVPASKTGIPSKRTKKGGAVSGSYPMPDKAHARNALSRVAQHGTPAEKAKVRAKANKMLGKKKGKK
jgi:hypothetical protein